MQQNWDLLKRDSVQQLFKGYYHDESTLQVSKKEGHISSSMITTMATKPKQTSETMAGNPDNFDRKAQQQRAQPTDAYK